MPSSRLSRDFLPFIERLLAVIKFISCCRCRRLLSKFDMKHEHEMAEKNTNYQSSVCYAEFREIIMLGNVCLKRQHANIRSSKHAKVGWKNPRLCHLTLWMHPCCLFVEGLGNLVTLNSILSNWYTVPSFHQLMPQTGILFLDKTLIFLSSRIESREREREREVRVNTRTRFDHFWQEVLMPSISSKALELKKLSKCKFTIT